MKLIPLSQNQFAKVDDEDFEELNQFKWHTWLNESTNSFYACRNAYVDGKRGTIYMHRVIMSTPKSMKCDHKDHDTLNNQRYNLRNCTNAQNMMNRKGVNSNNKTGVLGVSFDGYAYRVRIYKEKREIYLGYFFSLDEAIKVRKEAEIKYFGEFAGNKEK